LKSINKKNKVYKKFIKSKDQQYYIQYKYYREILNRLIRKNKRNHYNNYFATNINNIKKIWIGINELTNRKVKNRENITCLNINNEIISDPSNVANHFNRYFTSVAKKLADKIKVSEKRFDEYLTSPIEKSIFIQPTCKEEVVKLLLSIDPTKSPDIYGISPKIINSASIPLAPILTEIVNSSFENGIFPQLLKNACVSPIFKGGSRMEISNYRPVSILPILSKIIEKLMHERLTKFVMDNNIIYEHQFGFQKDKSTTLAVMDMTEKIIRSFEKKDFACNIFLDFAKAFDTINHEILASKLEYYGIRGVAKDWFISYLSNRYQSVKIEQSISSKMPITCGVPQGSILGPLLFLIYINDIKQSSDKLMFFLFADDTSTYISGNDLKVIETICNEELEKVSEWLRANKLSLNVSKSNMVLFRNHNRKLISDIFIKIDNELINQKNYVKYLGIYIDKNLSWKEHISNIKIKLDRGIGMLSKLRIFAPRSIILKAYHAFITPHINYGILNWGNASDTALSPIIKCLEKANSIVNSLYPHNERLFSLKNFHNLAVSKFIWKLHNEKLPNCIKEMFTEKTNNIVMRNSNRFILQRVNTEAKRRFITFYGLKLWNTIETEIKNSKSIEIFNKRIKSSLNH